MRTTPRATQPTGQPPQSSRAAPLATSGVLDTTTPPSAPPLPATAAPAPSIPPTSPVIVQPRPVPTPTNQQRWLAQQLNRQSFDPPRSYVAPSGTALFWFDPRTGQTLEI